ncbi:hypothetical protein IEQ34_021334 [Dendrobium chrysotoxum]|uniref:Uncharacterized protein n=1 Tax=Dendrobium chrysotoxum TaxID=161865 RepID=A0AAV7G378_DENCH|nr:hypothetical protein IEQ34_021334 [Dendrobium chrysotoxum]
MQVRQAKAGSYRGRRRSQITERIVQFSENFIPANYGKLTHTSHTFLSLTNGMNKGSRSKCLDAAVAEASGGAAITKELERMINNIMVKSKYGRHIDDLKISAKMIHRHHRPSRIRRARPGRR